MTSPHLCDVIRFDIKRNPIAICAVQITHIFIGRNLSKSVWNPILISYPRCLRPCHRPPMRPPSRAIVPFIHANFHPTSDCDYISMCVHCLFSDYKVYFACGWVYVRYSITVLQVWLLFTANLHWHTPTRSGFSACFFELTVYTERSVFL